MAALLANPQKINYKRFQIKEQSFMVKSRRPLSNTHFFPAPPKRINVLVVDDHHDKHMIMGLMLHTVLDNPNVEHAYDGIEALKLVHDKLAKCKNYDVIIMDYHMPVIKGDEITRLIRHEEGNFPELHKSLIVTWSTVKSSPYHGANDVLPKKTNDINVLADVLERHGFKAKHQNASTHHHRNFSPR